MTICKRLVKNYLSAHNIKLDLIALYRQFIPLFSLEDMFDETRHDANSKSRFCAYRFLVFWLYPDIKRGERRPLPACLYSFVQATFPPTDNEEEFADWQFSKFVYGEELDD